MSASVDLSGRAVVIHTIAGLSELFDDVATRISGVAALHHVIADGLLERAQSEGATSESVIRHLQSVVDEVWDAGADAVLVSCSTVAPTVSELRTRHDRRPVLRIDQAVAEEAVATGSRISIIATVPSAIPPFRATVERAARAAGKEVAITEMLAAGAFEARQAGDVAKHDAQVSTGIRDAAFGSDVVVLAQATMASAVTGDAQVTVLTSPATALGRLLEQVEHASRYKQGETTMRALRKLRAEPGLVVAEVAVPVPAPHEVLVRIEAASVCGTDLSYAAWTPAAQSFGSPLPLTIGHEAAGHIIEVGKDVNGFEVGQMVALESHISCGECAACQRDAAHNCLDMDLLGVTREGVFAEFVAIPAAAVFPVRDGVPVEAAALYESAGVAMHAVQRAGDVTGATVAVTGAGPVGLFLVALLKAAGAAHIAVLEPTAARRARAEELGAVGFDVDQTEEFVAFGREHGGINGADVGFDVSGAASAYDSLFAVLGRESRLVSVGHPSADVAINISRDVNKRVITWSGVFGRHLWTTWERLDALVASGAIDLADFIEGSCALADVPGRLGEIAVAPGKFIIRP